ncbi:MAG: hypothetical protein ACNS62_11665 [Candidatus Cyclobacteriaceae bacterium M3_2C_046]
MKTLKNTIIAIGIIVAILTLSTSLSFGNHIEPFKTEEKAKVQYLKSLENKLIENYLEKVAKNSDTPNLSDEIKIFDANDQLVFKGKAESKDAKLLLLNSAKLTTIEGTEYYIINK